MQESKWAHRPPRRRRFRPWERIALRIRGYFGSLRRQRTVYQKYRPSPSARLRALAEVQSPWARLLVIALILHAAYYLTTI
jgi:hypothetical protein